MQYCSTRCSLKRLYSFREVLFSGFAPDGGMFMPECLPTLSIEMLQRWKNLSFRSLLCEISSLFISEQEIPKAQLQELISSALSSFSLPDTVRLVHLKESLCLLELFHGETLAFKDLAMTCTAHFLRYFLHRDSSRAIILVGTSGDTGSSAIRSVLGMNEVDIIVLFPRGHITHIQELQMTTSIADNVYVFAADGTSDDIDLPIRKLFADSDLVVCHALMSLNSVNWSRIMVQTTIFLFAYLKLIMLHANDGELPELEVVVPSGGAGNITAGLLIKQMGVPLHLVAMVNANDIIYRTVQFGDLSMFSTVTHTLAPAIDIQDPYNMERVFWMLSGGDGALVKSLMEDFHSNRKTTLPAAIHQNLKEVMSSGSVCDEGILQTMRRCWEENHYLLCPHTAVAVWKHYESPLRAGETRCCLATASPAKFAEAVHQAGLSIDLPESLQALHTLPTRFKNLEKWEDWEENLRKCIKSISEKRKREQGLTT